MEPLGIEGAWTVTPRINRDNRGSFLEWFRHDEFARAAGYQFCLAQVNCSVSRYRTLRGIHFSDVPPGQAKYVMCVSGAVIDVVVDLRVGSPGFGQWEAVRLDDQTRRAVFISEGLGHGFMADSPEATVMYLCSTPYAPGREHGIYPLDPTLGIHWPSGAEPILSEKDAKAPSLHEAQLGGLLPVYEECTAFVGRQRSSSAVTLGNISSAGGTLQASGPEPPRIETPSGHVGAQHRASRTCAPVTSVSPVRNMQQAHGRHVPAACRH
jgi:dTDP-4-dehydrorhamnose 3,5-epimerase